MPSKKPRAKVPKTKTFGGCWTCRRRKVKCDNVRPKCGRCSKDYKCEGYDVELFWMPIGITQEPESSVKGRKAMLLRDERIPTSCNVAEVHDMLLRLEEEEGGSITTRKCGPFSVFAPSRRQRITQIINPPQTPPEDPQFYGESDLSVSVNIYDVPGTTIDPKQTAESSESDIQLPDINFYSPSEISTFSQLHELELSSHFFDNKMTRELMHNYVTVVADLLQPAEHAQNPYKSIYVPTALAGSANSLFGISKMETSHSNVAVFHALLSVSAFHLRGVESLPERALFDKLGRLHRVKAFESLQKALLGKLKRRDQSAAISAMMSLVSSDLMDGGMNEFWIHLDGCERLQQLITNDLMHQEPYKQLHTVCSFMGTMARSMQQDFVPLRWPEIKSADDVRAHIASPFETSDHSLEFTYGITRNLASFIHITTKLNHYLVYYTINDLIIPKSLQCAVNDHGKRIAKWSLAQETFPSINHRDVETLSIIQHHAIAFHRAIWIHFNTMLLRILPANIAAYSQIVAESLIAAESLKKVHAARYGWKSMAPVVWPGFIASCEADIKSRELWCSWWTSVQKYRIGSIARLWGVVQEVWDTRDGGNVEVPGWAPILRANGLRIISGG